MICSIMLPWWPAPAMGTYGPCSPGSCVGAGRPRRRRPNPRTDFQVKFKGRDIRQWRLPDTGVTYSDELDWRLAARWAGYKFDDFQLLDGEEQSSIVAAYTL